MRSRRPRRATALVPCVLAWTLAAAPAAAASTPVAPGGSGLHGVSLTPAVVEQTVNPRAVALDFVVANNESFNVNVRLSVQGLQQALDGTFGYSGPVAGLTVSPSSVLMSPGAHAQVQVRGSLPPGTPSLYAGVLAEPRSHGTRAAAAGNVEIRTRVASVLLLTTPGAHARGIAVEDVSLTPAGTERQYRVSAVLRNVGQVHERPAGTVELSQPGGPVLGVAQLGGGLLLPGAARRLDGGIWTAPPATPERLDGDVTVADPATRARRSVTVPPWRQPVEGANAPEVLPHGGLPELGGPDAAGPHWLVWVALALLVMMAALLTAERLRHARPAFRTRFLE